jgi:catalase
MLSPQGAIDTINARFGRHRGFRALHAKGQFLTGTFSATPAAAALTRAAHMRGGPVAVTARFSNGGGDPTVPDYAPDVRGLAVGFHLAGGQRTDIVAQSVPRFPVSTPEAFLEFMRALQPGLPQLWKLPAFLARHPRALVAMKVSAPALIKPPASYASIPYFAVHAYAWTAPDGVVRHVRYRWQPEREERLAPGQARKRGRDYLQAELRERLQRGAIRSTLVLQIAEPGDDVDDPASVWPASRQEVVAGALELNALVEREQPGQPFVFDPVRVTDGIGLTRDPVLLFRPRAYSVSIERRAG